MVPLNFAYTYIYTHRIACNRNDSTHASLSMICVVVVGDVTQRIRVSEISLTLQGWSPSNTSI